ncbi:hypothetical protein, partial [Salmonella enterica]|uniref:hypothetical protein n=1 Tax=Salmonella enterica TaxID=28901 RepID=UPI00329921DE
RREAELASAQLDLFADLAPADAPLVPGRPAPQPHSSQLPPGARWREVMAEGQLIRFVLQRSRRRTIGFLI